MYPLLLFLATFYGCQGQGTEPQYVLTFDSPIYVCSDDESISFIDTSGIEVEKYNQSFAYMTGHVTFLKGLGQNSMIEILIYKDANGRQEVVFTFEICDICEEIGNEDSAYYKYLKFFGFPDKCPFESSDYKINNLVAETDDLPINSANAGRYTAEINILHDPDSKCKSEQATLLACIKFNFLIEMGDK